MTGGALTLRKPSDLASGLKIIDQHAILHYINQYHLGLPIQENCTVEIGRGISLLCAQSRI